MSTPKTPITELIHGKKLRRTGRRLQSLAAIFLTPDEHVVFGSFQLRNSFQVLTGELAKPVRE